MREESRRTGQKEKEKFILWRERLTDNHQIKMLVLILFFSVRGSNAGTGASVEGRTSCQNGFCITLSEAEIRAEAGLCVVIPCSFTTAYGFTAQHLVWYKCEQSKQRCSDSDMIFHANKYNRKVQSGFTGRVFLLEPDVSLNNCSIIINDLTESDSGSYQLRVNGLFFGRSEGFTFSPRASVSVKALIQKPTVLIPPLTEGQQTTLTCTAPGLCSGPDPKITWTWRGAGEKASQITGNISAVKTENVTAVTQRHSSTLTFNPSAEHHGSSVTCEVIFTGNRTTEETVTLNVILCPKILTSSKCEVQSEVLTCVCISEGFPLPTIRWPLLKNHTEYSVINTVSEHTVNSTITLTVKEHSSTSVECVSSNENGEAKENLSIRKTMSEKEGQSGKLLTIISRLEVILSFFIGVLLSAVICCLALKCTRQKQKSSRVPDAPLEMVTSQEDPLIDAGQSAEDDQTYYQEAAEEDAAAEKAAPELNGEPKDVEYASIDFSALQRKSRREAVKKHDSTETEYAEIKKQVKGEEEYSCKEEAEELEDKEEEAMIVEDEEREHPVLEKEEGKDEAVYSNVKDVMSENEE